MGHSNDTRKAISGCTDAELTSGIHNLLFKCAQIKPQERLLLVGEVGSQRYYDDDLCALVNQIAVEIGALVSTYNAEPVANAKSVPNELADMMSESDVVIFFSRLGDQIRFTDWPGTARKVMCYTLTKAHLGAPFASLDYSKMTDMVNLLESLIRTSSTYRIETPDGTQLTGEIVAGDQDSSSQKFFVSLFPVMIFEPIICHNLSGTLTVSRFITSTSTTAYDQSVLRIQSPVTARVNNSVITALAGDTECVNQVDRQLNRAAQLSGGDPYVLNSWHTGINPGTFFSGNPFTNLERWGTVAYGSPRYTHFHGAGHAPGDVAYNLMDASIWFDDQMLWQKGKFAFLDRPEVQALFNADEQKILNAQYRLDIGL